MKWLATLSILIFISSSSSSSALSQSDAMFVELGRCSQNTLSKAFWTLNISLLQFDEYSELYSRSKSLPIKNQLYLLNTPSYVLKQMFA